MSSSGTITASQVNVSTYLSAQAATLTDLSVIDVGSIHTLIGASASVTSLNALSIFASTITGSGSLSTLYSNVINGSYLSARSGTLTQLYISDTGTFRNLNANVSTISALFSPYINCATVSGTAGSLTSVFANTYTGSVLTVNTATVTQLNVTDTTALRNVSATMASLSTIRALTISSSYINGYASLSGLNTNYASATSLYSGSGTVSDLYALRVTAGSMMGNGSFSTLQAQTGTILNLFAASSTISDLYCSNVRSGTFTGSASLSVSTIAMASISNLNCSRGIFANLYGASVTSDSFNGTANLTTLVAQTGTVTNLVSSIGSFANLYASSITAAAFSADQLAINPGGTFSAGLLKITSPPICFKFFYSGNVTLPRGEVCWDNVDPKYPYRQNSNGRFVVPVSGIYTFTLALALVPPKASAFLAWLTRASSSLYTSSIIDTYGLTGGSSGVSEPYPNLERTIQTPCNQGDVIQSWTNVGSAWKTYSWSSRTCYFSGALLYAF